MAWSTPITDRTYADILAENSKAYMNVSDWQRIYDNSVVVYNLLSAIYDTGFDTVTTASTSIDPNLMLSMANSMLGNIERMRWWIATYLSQSLDSSFYDEIKDDWEAGNSKPAPDFTHVNQWENDLLIMYNFLGSWTPPTISGYWQWVSFLPQQALWQLVAGGSLAHV